MQNWYVTNMIALRFDRAMEPRHRARARVCGLQKPRDCKCILSKQPGRRSKDVAGARRSSARRARKDDLVPSVFGLYVQKAFKRADKMIAVADAEDAADAQFGEIAVR